MENENRNTDAALTYSYHTFMYPFSYDAGKDEGKLQIDGQLWEEEADPKEGKVLWENGQDVPEEALLVYNEYQYFFPQARRYIFNSSLESEHVLYRMKGLDGLQGRSTYQIKTTKIKGTGEQKKEILKQYELLLRNIRLSVYPRLKIGILLFETEYEKHSLADVLDINDLGRRLFAPCIAYQDQRLKSILTADEISIFIQDGRNYAIQFHQKEYNNEQEIAFIRQILGILDEQTKIKSILDDRMFTVCLVRDGALADTPFLKNLHRGLEDWEQEGKGIKDVRKIYEFIFMDRKGDCTCHSRRMLEQELKAHIYDRWIDYGTFHGITEYSFVCATGEDKSLVPQVINPFLTSYVDMAKLALAQRAALTKIEDAIPEIPDGGLKEDEDVERIRKVWEQYLLCQCKLCLPEVTFQQQGAEIYRMLKEALGIHGMNAQLEEKLDNLHNVAELYYQQQEQESDKKVNTAINMITYIGLFLTCFSVYQDFVFGAWGSEATLMSWLHINNGTFRGLLGAGLLVLWVAVLAIRLWQMFSKYKAKRKNP